MNLRYGLRAKFALLAGVVVLVLLAISVSLLRREDATHREVQVLSRESMHELAFRRLQSHGRSSVMQAADILVNPLYYFDLEAIGGIVRNHLRQPDVAYAIVYDAEGRVVHDGSRDIATYGQPMNDPLAYEVLQANDVHVQTDEGLFDISVPIRIGDERLGGFRVGYSLATVKADEDRIGTVLGERLDDVSRRHKVWVGTLLALMAGMVAVLAMYLQRSVVGPIRALADAARRIEAGDYEADVPASGRRDEIGDLVRSFAHMRDSIARHSREVRRMAYTDTLTGLANRLSFRETLDQRLFEASGAARQLALLFADIDDFKRVNDTIGHDAGDEVLMQFAARMRDVLDRHVGKDTVLARFGGDEFVILLDAPEDGTGMRDAAAELAAALVEELGRPIMVHGRHVFLGISIGISLSPDDASNASALMKNGDIAMYQAKVAGKNCYRFYSRAMDQAVERRVRMEQDLRGAWERGELSLAYQPVFRLSDGKLAGAEALLRWNHPQQGYVSPSLFIDVAEQSGLIETIGPQVLRAACFDLRRWQRDFPAARDLFVAVNVSPRQLRAGDLSAQVESVLRETGLAPQHLHIELTETAVIGDEARVSALLSRLREAGVKVWLDDFGTGFSGLSHLRRVPVDGVKIDRSFVADVLRDPDDLALTTAIIAMAHSLGIEVVAEGVEKEGQYTILRERGCDLAQGFWLGHPMAARDFASLLV